MVEDEEVPWEKLLEIEDVFTAYDKISLEIKNRPVTLELQAPEETNFDGMISGGRRIFTPSLQYQRNAFAFGEIRELAAAFSDVKTIGVLGCGELSLEKYCTGANWGNQVSHIISVDVSETPLARGVQQMEEELGSLHTALSLRDALPILLEVYKGDVSEPSQSLRGIDVAVALEVIEHMPLESATSLLRNVLTATRPRAFILSTPNFEFNVVFGNPELRFRHDDHHFEFTRDEFAKWLEANVPEEYDYRIEYVGKMREHADLDGATQFAIIELKEETSKVEERESRLQGPPFEKVQNFIIRNSWRRVLRFLVLHSILDYLEKFNFADHSTLITPSSSDDASSSPRDLSFHRVPVSDILVCRPSCALNLDIDLRTFTKWVTNICTPYVLRSSSPDESQKDIPFVAIRAADPHLTIAHLNNLYNRLE